MIKKLISSPICPFILVIIASSVFRLTNLDLIEFKKDETINLFLASRPFFGHPFPPGATVSSIGILNPPIFNYLLVPPLFFTFNPIYISFYIALVNCISIGLLFLIIRRYYNSTIGLISCLLMAFSPWAIIFSRKIWAQDFIIPLFIPIFYSLHKIVFENKNRYWILLTSFSLFIIQLHQASIFFITLLFIIIIVQKRNFNFRYFFIGIFIGLIPLIPYIIYQYNYNCPDCHSLLSSSNRLSIARSLKLFIRPLQIINYGDFRLILGDDMSTLLNQYPLIYKLRSIFYVEYLILSFSLILFLIKLQKARFFIISLIALPFIYFILRIEPFIHYFIITTPFLFLILGYGFYFLIKRKNIFVKFISIILLCLLISTSFAFNYAFFNILSKNGNLKGDYGASFKIIEKQITKKMSKYKNDKYYQEMVIASYLPKDLMYGFLPVPQMLYNYKKTKENLNQYDNRLQASPEDERIIIELLSYYTQSINRNTIKLLKEKSKKIHAYTTIYEEANILYERKYPTKKTLPDNSSVRNNN